LNNNKWWVSILLGIVMGLAYFTKMTALMFPVAVFFYGLLDRKRFKYMLIACIVAGLIWLGFIFYNIQKFDYPLFPIVNKLWKFIDPNVLDPYQTYPWVEEFEAKVNPPIDIIAAFGLFPFLVLLGGLAYSLFGISDNIKGFFKRDEMLVYLMIATFIFAWFFVIGRGVEERYLSVLFPTLVILAAVPFADIAKSNALFLIITLAFCGILLYVAYKGINATSSVARFPENYVKSLEWIKQNTDDDSVIFTVYGGSVYNYGRRERTWLYENFSKVMTSDDSKYILGQLESRDADYILLWGSLIADNYIIPESNIYGVFTWKFVQAVLADSENFPVVFALEDVVVVHVGSVQVNNPPLKCVGLSLKES